MIYVDIYNYKNAFVSFNNNDGTSITEDRRIKRFSNNYHYIIQDKDINITVRS